MNATRKTDSQAAAALLADAERAAEQVRPGFWSLFWDRLDNWRYDRAAVRIETNCAKGRHVYSRWSKHSTVSYGYDVYELHSAHCLHCNFPAITRLPVLGD